METQTMNSTQFCQEANEPSWMNMFCFETAEDSSFKTGHDQVHAQSPSNLTPPSTKVVRSCGGDFVRQSCKARSVAILPGQNPHCARFAYIDIPSGTKHGTVLSCCHPFCVASGRRFRYCAYCEVAVAKRNFTVRHSHGAVNTSGSRSARMCVSPTTFAGAPDKASSITRDAPQQSIPSTVSVGTNEKPVNHVDLSSQEAYLISLLRSRPASEDHPYKFVEWKSEILKATEQLNNTNIIEPIKTESEDSPVPELTPEDGENLSVLLSDEDSLFDNDFEGLEAFLCS